jgi:hypothetical protein
MLKAGRFVNSILVLMVSAGLAAQEAVPVTVVKNGDCFSLHRGGEPYWIKGAGGQEYLDRVAAYGGNSIRLWSSKDPQDSGKTVQEILDEANSFGITVTLGLWVKHPRHDPDFYDDPVEVEAQLEAFRTDVQKYRDHPALLMWAVGNEVHLNTDDMRVWDAVGDIAAMIKQEDPNHPVTTVTANINSTIVGYINDKVPDLDILGINAYGNELLTFPQKVRNAGWNKPYFMGEFGPNMHWQVNGTAWGAKFEPLNSEKAATYAGAYQAFENDDCLCMGAYAFKWGWKWERTYSWINLFTPEGHETAVVDALQNMWSGTLPENEAPFSGRVYINGVHPLQSDTVEAGSTNYATCLIQDADEDLLSVEWILYEEGTSDASGGDAEPTPPTIKDFILENHTDSIIFQAPPYGGPFRLYIFVYDTANNVSISNYPFFVSYPDVNFEGDSLVPTDDTYARGGTYASQNYGTAIMMVTKQTDNASYNRESFLKFKVGNVGNGISEAYLHTYGTIVNSVEIEVYGSVNNSWSEKSLTWNNRPSADVFLDRITIPDNSESYFSWNVSSFVSERHARGEKYVTLVLKANTETEKEIPWSTKESGINVPFMGFVRSYDTSELVVTMSTLTVQKGSSATIDQDHLDITGTYATAINLTIEELPESGDLLKNNVLISESATIKQSEINDGLLVYRHEGGSAEADSFVFSVTDPTGANIKDQVFHISIDPSMENNPQTAGWIRVFPNPAGHEISIGQPWGAPGEVTCFNILGEQLDEFRRIGKNTFFTGSLTPGIYIIRLTIGDRVFTSRFIKE